MGFAYSGAATLAFKFFIFMKKILTFISIVMLSVISCKAGDKKEIITVEQLPKVSQQFITLHFSKVPVLSVIKETEGFKVEYEVRLQSGTQIDFDSKGEWKKVDAKTGELVPDSIIPEQIKTKVNASYPGVGIEEIEKEHGRYDVKLNNGIELHFDKNFEMRIDD